MPQRRSERPPQSERVPLRPPFGLSPPQLSLLTGSSSSRGEKGCEAMAPLRFAPRPRRELNARVDHTNSELHKVKSVEIRPTDPPPPFS